MTDNEFELEVVSVRIVRDAPIISRDRIQEPADAVRLIADYLNDFDREVVCVVNLNGANMPINCNFASIGALTEALIHPREILKAAFLSNAASIILLHFHPSGSLKPSISDIAMTDRMVQVCALSGIPLIDHIIVGNDAEEFFSFREKDILSKNQLHLKQDYKDIDFDAYNHEEMPRKRRHGR